MPAEREDLVIMRILVRHGFSRDLADLLLSDLQHCVNFFSKHPIVNGSDADESSNFNHG